MVIYKKSRLYSDDGVGGRLGLSPIITKALRARGVVSDEQIARFLEPNASRFHDPFLLNDMDKAVERINSALKNGEKICIFGDYDVDGICSTAMLTDYFRSVGADVIYHIPSRSEEGYGMTEVAIVRLYESGVQLIITVDNGISAANEIRRCGELGMDVIVTDHHIPPENMPECTAVVSHTVPGSRYPAESKLCGAGTAFKLLHALCGLDGAMKYISLAGLASVADVVPLLDENRVLTKLALDAMNGDNCCRGLKRLLESLSTLQKPYTACNLSFNVAPRLNAPGRMSDASISVELFLSNDDAEIASLIAEMNRFNELRQKEEADILEDALSMLRGQDLSETRAIVLCNPKWAGGVVGVAASRLLDMFHRPTVLFCESGGKLKGSARSMDGINIHDAFTAVKDCFLRFGGHAKAAGITMEHERLDEFRERLNEHLRSTVPSDAFIPRNEYEFEIPLGEVSAELINELSLLAPFGECNPSPVFRTAGVEASKLRRFGCDSQHTRMEVRRGADCFEAVWFSSSAFFNELLTADKLDILYTPMINKWCGNERLQLRIRWAQSEPPSDIDAFLEKGEWNFAEALTDNSVCYTDEPDVLKPTPALAPLESIFKSRISGVAAMAFSPEGAKLAIESILKNGLNVDICFGAPHKSSVCDNTLVIAPIVNALPESGFSTVVIVDEPPTNGLVDAISRRMSASEIFVSSLGAVSGHAYASVASRFITEREFMVECYRGAMSQLSSASISFDELAFRLSDGLKTPKYRVRFALRVFVELGFIVFNQNDSLSIGDTTPRCLGNSRLYQLVRTLKNESKN